MWQSLRMDKDGNDVLRRNDGSLKRGYDTGFGGLRQKEWIHERLFISI